ncbi:MULTISPECIES: hypothetical protein [unclassified Cellulophaga]|uniref:hypothetical protein n=1 Tax=unclassified Cellulophaga TaxID=2634405 RepID=UPI0026E3C9D3|nr:MULTISPECIES: hypothetical protein [unclassified Cellulophaga]MDO6490129.1 hypothetical protein [Cellulophaga sp. 2_MG-2023]MDO6494677.1 hypothetical protein [Cellulophaga sp. 3_MG-2023]
MKNISKFILAAVILSGALFTTNTQAKLKKIEKMEYHKTIPCHDVFTICDNANPDSYESFDLCMRRNGC